MRDPDRLYKFYAVLCDAHHDYFPDWRFGQLVHNFTQYAANIYGIDIFFLEEEQFLEYFNDFCKTAKGGK